MPLDKLTRLYTADLLHQQLEKELLRARRYGRELALVGLAFDAPATAGGQLYPVLKLAAAWVRGSIRSVDLAVRAGHQIWLLLPETGREGGEALGAKLRSHIEDHVRQSQALGGVDVEVRTAVVSYPSDGEDRPALLEALRVALGSPEWAAET